MISVAYAGVRSTGPGTLASRSSKPGIFSIRYGRSAKNAPPMTSPARERSPPTTVIVTKNSERLKFHALADTDSSPWAMSAPARPAMAPDTTKANSVAIRTLMPNVEATRGFSRRASSARPPLLRIIRQSR